MIEMACQKEKAEPLGIQYSVGCVTDFGDVTGSKPSLR